MIDADQSDAALCTVRADWRSTEGSSGMNGREIAVEFTDLWKDLDISEINTMLAKNVSMEMLEFFSSYANEFVDEYFSDEAPRADQLRERIPNLLIIGDKVSYEGFKRGGTSGFERTHCETNPIAIAKLIEEFDTLFENCREPQKTQSDLAKQLQSFLDAAEDQI